ncbi:MAG: hypothetical protein F6K39_06090 [Okeania sp. SIO3B3]|nr:hypothetical protein [Okeania sp. SIO3B3]
MKFLAILNQEKIVKGFGMRDFPPADVAKLFGAEYQLSFSKGYIQIKIHPLKIQENQQNIQGSNNNVFTDYLKFKNRQYGIALTHQNSFDNQN